MQLLPLTQSHPLERWYQHRCVRSVAWWCMLGSLRLVGMPVPTVLPLLGPTLDTLLVQQTGDTLFGSSLHASLPASYQEYLRE